MSFHNTSDDHAVLDIHVNPLDYKELQDPSTPTTHSNTNPHQHHQPMDTDLTQHNQMNLTPNQNQPTQLPDPFPIQNYSGTNHTVVSTFQINTHSSFLTPPPYIHLEMYSKTPVSQNMYPFIMSKTLAVGHGKWIADPKFISHMLQGAQLDAGRMFPYKDFKEKGVDFEFTDPEISYYYNQGKETKSYKYTHPANNHIQHQAPQPLIYNPDKQPYIRLAVYVQMRTTRRDLMAAFNQDDVDVVAPILEHIERAKRIWLNMGARMNHIPPPTTRTSERTTSSEPPTSSSSRDQDLRQQLHFKQGRLQLQHPQQQHHQHYSQQHHYKPYPTSKPTSRSPSPRRIWN